MRKITAVLLTAFMLILCGCAAVPDVGQEAPAQPVDFSEVCNDGQTVVETRRLLRLPGSTDVTEFCYLEVRLTNLGTGTLYYSSQLCLEVSCDGITADNDSIIDGILAARSQIEGFDTIDGAIGPGQTAEGFLVFEAPAGAVSFDIRLAADFCKDEWVQFSCEVS